MTARELVDAGYCGFEEMWDFEGEGLADKVLTIMEREDGVVEKVISYGLCAVTGVYLAVSIVRALV